VGKTSVILTLKMEDKTLTTAFLVARFSQQANNKVYGGTNTSYGERFASGINNWNGRTEGGALILKHNCLAFNKIATPNGSMVMYDGVYSADMTPADNDIKDKCQLLQITPDCKTNWDHHGPEFLITHFKHGDVEYHADPSLVEKVKNSKFHTMDKVDCCDPSNKQTCKEMFEFQNSFYTQQRSLPSDTQYDTMKTTWTQHLKHWFNRGYIQDTANLSDTVRQQYQATTSGDNDVESVFKTIFRSGLDTNINF